VSAQRAQPGAGPAFETQIVTAAEITVWLLTARPGDRFVYCTGPAMLPGPTQELLAELRRAERVRTHQRRIDGRLEHFMVLREAGRAPVEVVTAKVADMATEKIYAAIARAARRGRRCPSDRELARIAGLATRNQASWRLRQLVEAGRVKLETVPGPDRLPWRVAIAGGRRTKGVPA